MNSNPLDSIEQSSTFNVFQTEGKEKAAELLAQQVDNARDMLTDLKEEAFNPNAMRAAQKLAEPAKSSIAERTAKAKQEQQGLATKFAIEKIKNATKGFAFNSDSQELFPEALLKFLGIEEGDSVANIINKLAACYPDPNMALEVIDFLKKTMGEDAPITKKLEDVRDFIVKNPLSWGKSGPDKFQRDYNDREVRQMLSKSEESKTVFDWHQELKNYDPEEIKQLVHSLLHVIGEDIKEDATTIEPAKLIQKVKEVRTFQAIIGVYRVFEEQMPGIEKGHPKKPSNCSVENLTSAFLSLVRNPSPTMYDALSILKMVGL